MQKVKEKFIESLSLTWENFMIRGGSEFLKFIKVHQKGFWLNRVISQLVFVSSCALHMANINQEQHSIRNIQVVSSNCVHSTHLCEANKCRIFKPFFLFIR